MKVQRCHDVGRVRPLADQWEAEEGNKERRCLYECLKMVVKPQSLPSRVLSESDANPPSPVQAGSVKHL